MYIHTIYYILFLSISSLYPFLSPPLSLPSSPPSLSPLPSPPPSLPRLFLSLISVNSQIWLRSNSFYLLYAKQVNISKMRIIVLRIRNFWSLEPINIWAILDNRYNSRFFLFPSFFLSSSFVYQLKAICCSSRVLCHWSDCNKLSLRR